MFKRSTCRNIPSQCAKREHVSVTGSVNDISIQTPSGQIIVMSGPTWRLYPSIRHLFVSWDYDMRINAVFGCLVFVVLGFCLICFFVDVGCGAG